MRSLHIGIAISTAALIAEAGCVSTDNLNARAPSSIYQTDASIPQLEECLAQGFDPLGAPAVIHGDHRTIINYAGAAAIVSFIIYQRDGHTVVEERYPHMRFGGKLRRRVNYCVAMQPTSAEVK